MSFYIKKRMVVLCLFLLLIGVSCDRDTKHVLIDHYGECEFTLPFDYGDAYMGSDLYFESTYSWEEMQNLLQDAGYEITLSSDGHHPTMLIAVRQESKCYYYVLYDKTHTQSDRYRLCSATLMWNQAYRFLAPIHMMDVHEYQDTVNRGEAWDNLWRVYGSFDEVAAFYRATGREDYRIHEEEEMIEFFCQDPLMSTARAGTLLIQYRVEKEGDYLAIFPKSEGAFSR